VALKAMLDGLDDVPEALRELYIEKNGKFHLDVEGVVPQDRLREFRDHNIALMKEREELHKKLATFGEIDPAHYEEMRKRLEELDDKKMMDEGKIEELLNARTERLRTDYDTQIKAYQKKLTDLEGSHHTLADELAKERIDGRLRDVAATTGVRKTALPDLINRGRQVWRLMEGVPVAMQGEQLIYGKDPAKPIGMDEWVTSLADEAPHLFEPTSGSGASNQSNGAARGIKVLPRGDPLAFGKHLEDIASGKILVQ
jgi:hypothetical protein